MNSICFSFQENRVKSGKASFFDKTFFSKKVLAKEYSGVRGLFNGAMAKILDFLLPFEEFEYSKSEIARNSEVNYETLSKLWEKLEYYGIVKEAMTDGKTTLFTLNTESPIVGALKKLQYEMMFHDADKIAREQAGMEEAIKRGGEGEKEKVKA